MHLTHITAAIGNDVRGGASLVCLTGNQTGIVSPDEFHLQKFLLTKEERYVKYLLQASRSPLLLSPDQKSTASSHSCCLQLRSRRTEPVFLSAFQ